MYWAATVVPGISTSLPFASTILTEGLFSLPCVGRAPISRTSIEEIPNASSSFLSTVTPSMISVYLMKPCTSEIIG